MAVIKSLPKKDYDNIIDTFLKILDHTRVDIPEDLHEEWKARQKRLGLTGKFLPADSKLLESLGVKVGNFKRFLHGDD
jgi:hypothetical protein